MEKGDRLERVAGPEIGDLAVQGEAEQPIALAVMMELLAIAPRPVLMGRGASLVTRVELLQRALIQ